MAFLIHSTGDHRVPVNKLLPCGAITPKVGMALRMANGLLIGAAGTNKPTHICVEEHQEAVTANTLIHVICVETDIVFAAPLTVAGDNLHVGDKVTISADGLGVTATITDGVATVEKICGTNLDDTILVRFV